MPQRGAWPATEIIRAAAARHGIVFPDEDVAAAAPQLEALAQALGRLDELDLAAYEPTTYACFDG